MNLYFDKSLRIEFKINKSEIGIQFIHHVLPALKHLLLKWKSILCTTLQPTISSHSYHLACSWENENVVSLDSYKIDKVPGRRRPIFLYYSYSSLPRAWIIRVPIFRPKPIENTLKIRSFVPHFSVFHAEYGRGACFQLRVSRGNSLALLDREGNPFWRIGMRSSVPLYIQTAVQKGKVLSPAFRRQNSPLGKTLPVVCLLEWANASSSTMGWFVGNVLKCWTNLFEFILLWNLPFNYSNGT